MITDDFDERTIANMEVALDRACERFPKQLAAHEARKRVAARILERARRGERTDLRGDAGGNADQFQENQKPSAPA